MDNIAGVAPSLASELERLQTGLGTPLSLRLALTLPMLHVQRLPQLLRNILRHSQAVQSEPTVAFDAQILGSLIERFEGLCLLATGQTAFAVAAEEPVWFHGAISKERVDVVMAGQPEGTFMVRQLTGEEGLGLELIHKGRLTHHVITRHAGLFLVNSIPLGHASDLRSLVCLMSAPLDAWPAMLRSFVAHVGATAQDVDRERQAIASGINAHGEMEARRERQTPGWMQTWLARADPEACGCIDVSRLPDIAYRLGEPLAAEEIALQLTSLGVHAVGAQIRRSTFVAWLHAHPKSNQWSSVDSESLEMMEKALGHFGRLDANRRGFITEQQFKVLCANYEMHPEAVG